MNKYLKYGLLAAGGAGLLAAGGMAYVVATFNPNDYKPQIVQAVKDSKQRTLKLEGDIRLSLFPSIGAELGRISLSERNSDREFAAVDRARVSLALWPLFSGRAVVDEVSVSGLKASLVKFRDGKTNIDDLLGKDETGRPVEQAPAATTAKPPVMFDIAAILIENTELHYRDEGSGTEYALKEASLRTGRIAGGVPAKVDLSARLQASQPKLDLATQLKATLTLDPDRQVYGVTGMDLQAKGAVLDFADLVVRAGGDAGANLATQEFSAKGLAISANGTRGRDNFEAKLEVPSLSLARDKFSGDKLTASARLEGASGNMAATLVLPGVEGTSQFFKSGALTLELDVKQPEQSFNAKLSSPVAGNFEVQQFNLSDLRIALHATGDKLPGKSLSSELKGSVQVDGSRQSVQANLAGGLLQSQVRAKVAVNGFASPAIRFDVDLDQFDLDMYLPKKPVGAEAQSGAGAAAVADEPLDLSALKKLNLEGSLRAGSLKAANVKVSQLRLDVKAHGGVLNVDPLSASLYGGSMNGNVTVNAAQARPAFAVNEKLGGVSIGPLLKDAAGFDMLEGKGSVALNLNTQGDTVKALKKALGGSLAVSLADGAVKGINIARTMRGAGSLFGKQAQTQAANKDEKTDFSELKASFRVNNGVAHNDDLSLKSPLLRLSGNGDIDIGNDRIDYLARATLAGTLEGQGGKSNVAGITVPVRLSGPYTDLKYTLDFGAMVGGAVKQKVEAKKEEVKQQLQDKLKEGLKGLFR